MPPGCMPRTLDVVLRGEMAERAKAGDKCVFAGSLVVIPDVASLSTPGQKVEVVQKVRVFSEEASLPCSEEASLPYTHPFLSS